MRRFTPPSCSEVVPGSYLAKSPLQSDQFPVHREASRGVTATSRLALGPEGKSLSVPPKLGIFRRAICIDRRNDPLHIGLAEVVDLQNPSVAPLVVHFLCEPVQLLDSLL